MDPTALPTDNLYKFWALSCVFLLAVVWYKMKTGLQTLADEKRRVRLEIEKHKLQIDRLSKDKNQRDPDIEGLIGRGRALEEKQLELDSEREYWNSSTDHRVKWAGRSIAALVILLVLAIAGFVQWYRKHQWFQDQVTYDLWREQKAKSALAEIELANARTKPTTGSSSTAAPRSP